MKLGRDEHTSFFAPSSVTKKKSFKTLDSRSEPMRSTESPAKTKDAQKVPGVQVSKSKTKIIVK